MEKLDTYDENGKFLCSVDRTEVHAKGLWHKTVHCWLYTKNGEVIFQRRAENNKCYTSASGHISAGETLKEGFAREIGEELGFVVDIDKASLVEIVVWKMDKLKKDGTWFVDRVFANVYMAEFDGDLSKFDYQLEEVSGVVKVSAKDAINLLQKESGAIDAEILTIVDGKKHIEKQKITFEDFLVNEHETGIIKYGRVLEAIVNITK